jgi:hemoglobin
VKEVARETLYQRIGGEAAIVAAVDLFYDKVMADELTRLFFAGIDMPAQIKKQVAFMTMAFGGPHEYAGRDLKTAHARLVKDHGLTDVHFDAVAGHLESTLVEPGVEPSLIHEALTIVAGTRNQVLGR